MKLTQKKIRWIIKRYDERMPVSEIAFLTNVTERRIRQIIQSYKEKGRIPMIKKPGRKRRKLTQDEKEIIMKAYKKYKFGARLLERVLDERYGVHIPHNKIHEFLKEKGFAKENKNKQKKRKWIRYEREHSLSLVHMDWHEKDGMHLCIIEDDASRYILSAIERETTNMDYSIEAVSVMIENYYWIKPADQLLIDNGSEFGAHRKNKEGEWNSDFKKFVTSYGTKVITTRVKHPQTNGKLERLFGNYNCFRECFNEVNEWVDWYNNRPHGSLEFYGYLETPYEAFWRKLSPESLIHVMEERII